MAAWPRPMRGHQCADPTPPPLTGPLTARGWLSCLQMRPPRAKLVAAPPHFPTGFRVGTSHISGHAWTQMWVATGRIWVTDRSAPSGSCAVLSWVNRAPTRETRAARAGLTCANPAAPATDRESQCRGGGFLSLMRDARATMNACIHIDTRVGPLGLPARTGLLTAHSPHRIAPRRGLRYMPGVFAAHLSSRHAVPKVGYDLLVGATRFGGKCEFPGGEVECVADPL